MQSALFTNFTKEEFTGYWNGKGKTFEPGQSMWMPDYLAKHFAKHLTNRELVRTDKRGRAVYKGGENMTSPKKPEDVPIFMKLFNKAYTPDDEEDIGSKDDDVDALISSANKNRAGESPKKTVPPKPPASPEKTNTKAEVKDKKVDKQDPTQPQIITPPDFDKED